MPVSWEMCNCQAHYQIPSGWDLFRCACGQVYERVGSIWYPRREAKKTA